MKQGTNFGLRVQFDNLDFDEVEYIKFIFKQINSPNAKALKICSYVDEQNDGVTLASENDVNICIVQWSADETREFESGKPFYMDTLVKLKGSVGNPQTNIVQLTMEPTLFNSQGE